MTIRRFSLALFICAAPACANAQSFNCANAKSPSEKLICATPDLAKLDTALDEAASKALDVSLAERARFLTEQRRWLDERDKKCAIPAYDLAAGQRKSAIACLESAYRARNAAIEALVTKQAAARGADKTLCQRVVDSYKTIIGADPKAIFGKNAEKPLRAENPLTLLSERKDSGLALARGETIENYSAKKLERWARAQKPRFKISQNVKNEIADLEDQLVTIDRAPGTNFHMTSATQGTAHCVFGNYFEVKNGVAWRAGEPPWPGEGDGACGVTRAFGTIGGRAVAFEDDDGAYSPSIDNHLSIMAWNRGFFAAPCTIDFEYDPGFELMENDPHGGESDCKSAACAALKREALALAQAVHRAPLDARKAALAKLSEAQRKAFEALEKRAPTPGHSEPLKPAEQNDPSNYTDVAPLLTPLVYKDEVLLANVGHTTMGWRTYPDWSVKLQKLEKDQLTEVGEILVSMAPVRLRKATIR